MFHVFAHFKKNWGYKTIKSDYEVMSGKTDVNLDIYFYEFISPTLLNCFKNVPIASVDVEHIVFHCTIIS